MEPVLTPEELARETKADLKLRRWQLRQMLQRLDILNLAIEHAERAAKHELVEGRADLELAIGALERIAARDLEEIKAAKSQDWTSRAAGRNNLRDAAYARREG